MPRPRLPAAAAVPIMVLIGAMVATQTRINGLLATSLGTGPRAGILAALISFGVGLVLISLIVAGHQKSRASIQTVPRLFRERQLPRWFFFGGLGGAILVAAQGLSAAALGVALFTVALVAGQTISALVVDRVGLSPAGRVRVTRIRVIAASITIVAVGITSIGRMQSGNSDLKVELGIVLLMLLPLLAGAGSSVQQAINGRVGQVFGAWVGTWNNFVVGTLALAIVFAASLLVPGEITGWPNDWRLLLGGAIGMIFIVTNVILIRHFGLLLISIATLTGQMLMATILDWLDPQKGLNSLVLVGTAITFLAVIVVQWANSRARARFEP